MENAEIHPVQSETLPHDLTRELCFMLAHSRMDGGVESGNRAKASTADVEWDFAKQDTSAFLLRLLPKPCGSKEKNGRHVSELRPQLPARNSSAGKVDKTLELPPFCCLQRCSAGLALSCVAHVARHIASVACLCWNVSAYELYL